MLELYSYRSRSITSFHINIHYSFIFNHLLFTAIFAQTVTFAMWVKPPDNSSPESMNTYRNRLRPNL